MPLVTSNLFQDICILHLFELNNLKFLTTHRNRILENTVGNYENAGNQHFFSSRNVFYST